MEKRVIDALAQAGICADSLLERLMNNEMLVGRFLKRFLEDDTYHKLVDAFARGDESEALRQSHTLKGTCGNLSMDSLYDLLSQQVQFLREGNWQAAQNLMPAIVQVYDSTVECIREEFE